MATKNDAVGQKRQERESSLKVRADEDEQYHEARGIDAGTEQHHVLLVLMIMQCEGGEEEVPHEHATIGVLTPQSH